MLSFDEVAGTSEPIPTEEQTVFADQAALIDYLRDRDTPCPACDYNLRGLTAPRCPECGEAVKLTVALADPYSAAWIALAIAVCGSAGLGLIFACIVARAGLPRQGRLLNGAILFYICTIPTPLPLIRTRRRFQRLTRQRQQVVAGLVVAVTVIALAILCTQLR